MVGRGSKHINARYFFLVDKIEKREVCVAYCLIEEMVADFSTKPTQGKVFALHRNTIMGITPAEFDLYKQWYKETLKRYELWDDMEKDLDSL